MTSDAAAPQRIRRVALVTCVCDDDRVLIEARQRALAGFGSAGHEVRVLDLVADGFDPVLDAQGWAALAVPGPAQGAAAEYSAALVWADTLVFVYPTVWGGQPALLKGWLDRVFTNGIAYDLVPGASRISGRLKQVDRIVVVTTYRTKRWRSRLHGEPGRRVMTRGVRALCGLSARSSWLALHGVDPNATGKRAVSKQLDWFDTIEQTAQSL